MDERPQRYLGLAAALIIITGAIVWVEAPWERSSEVPTPPEELPEQYSDLQSAPNFAGAVDWVNTDEPVDLVDQRGKVVLVDFWTYSCINCINTFPYLRAWHEAYADDGLVIVGVHTPEFRFERNVDNVQDATERYNLTYPVAIDNRYDIWDAYHNRFWPAKYLIGPYGKIHYTHFGEGAYSETENRIRDLLEAANRTPDNDPVYLSVQGGGVRPGQTPELFASHLNGYKRHAIGNEEGYHPGETITYAPVSNITQDEILLEGTWENTDEYVEATGGRGTVKLSFKAGGMNVVANDLGGACATVELDGDPIPRNLSGPDIAYENGTPCVHLDADRAYDIYSGPFERHQVTLDVPEGFQLYSFAFSREGRAR